MGNLVLRHMFSASSVQFINAALPVWRTGNGDCLWLKGDRFQQPESYSTQQQRWEIRGSKSHGNFHQWGYPKSSILTGFSLINDPFWGTPTSGNPHIAASICWAEWFSERTCQGDQQTKIATCLTAGALCERTLRYVWCHVMSKKSSQITLS